MRTSPFAALTALAVIGGSLIGVAAPAHADTTVRYVDKAATTCSDTGTGTREQPFCTIGAAVGKVAAGQTVEILGGTYPERVVLSSSGTAEQPITIRGGATGVSTVLSGAAAGFVIEGHDHITIRNLRVSGTVDQPGIDVRNAIGVSVVGVPVNMATTSTQPGIRLSAVTGATLRTVSIAGPQLASAVVVDAASNGVRIEQSTFGGGTGADSVGIDIAGSDTTIVGMHIFGFGDAAVAVQPDATGTVIANNVIDPGTGAGIRSRGASDTAITNNEVRDRCRDGIRIDGGSRRASVQNNFVFNNGNFGRSYCAGTPTDGVEIGVYGDAVTDTVVDYNNTYHWGTASSEAYAWNGSRMGLAAFRSASGQGAHDRDSSYRRDLEDAANSAAPGFQSLDRLLRQRADNPSVPNTGAGPQPYAERGPEEFHLSPIARLSLTLEPGTGWVTFDASGSQPGYTPITSYQFDFGDGTVVTHDNPHAGHRYDAPGTYKVTLTVAGAERLTGVVTQEVTVLPRTGTVGLLPLVNRSYVGNGPEAPLQAGRPSLDASAQFDLVDAGNGRVALLSHATGRYVSATESDGADVRAQSTSVTPWESFVMTRNADGTVSLKAEGNGRYVAAENAGRDPLIANRTAIGTWEKFYQVDVGNAGRSLKAKANNRYVTAENAGAKPLIANRTAVGLWERFDLVTLGNGQIGLFSHANRRFVTAESTGTKPLIANRTAIGLWERFTLVRNTDGSVSLKAAVNNRYVVAESAGTQPLIANRTAIGPWEKFTLS